MTRSTIERVVALHRVGLFADVPGRTLAALAQRAGELELEAGTVVIEEGAVEDHLYAIVDGRVRVHRGDETLAILGPGATVGELAALVPEPRAASVTALEPTTLLRIDKPLLDELLADRPALATGVIAALVAMVRQRGQPRDDPTGPAGS
jgi:CRP-like cAMP-binding protein